MKRFLGTLRLCLLVLCMFAPAVAHAGLLPDGYKRLEYIQSSGTQHINTGYTLTSNNVVYKWVAKDLNSSGSTSLFGSEASTAPKYSGILHGSKTGRSFYGGRTTGGNIGYASNDNNFHSWILDIKDTGRASLYKDGVLAKTITYITPLQTTLPIALFGNNMNNSVSQKSTIAIKSFSITDNGVLKRKMIPVKNPSGAIGMYDMVTKAFYKNNGTGTFIAGPEVGIKIATKAYNDSEFEPVQTALSNARTTVSSVVSNTISQSSSIGTLSTSKQNRPTTDCPQYRQCMLVQDANNQPTWFPIVDPFYDLFKPMIAQSFDINIHGSKYDMGYAQLDYIQSSGSQYIDTNILSNNDTGVFIDFQYTDNATNEQILFGNINNNFTFWRTGAKFYYAYKAATGKSGEFNIGSDAGKTARYTFKLNWLNDHMVALNNTILQLTPVTFSNSLSMYLFGAHYAQESSSYHVANARVYSAKISNGADIVRNFIPVQQNSTGAIGMYDTVSGAFFGKSGSGNFTYGAIVANTDVPAEPTWSVIITGNETGNTTGVSGTVYGTATCNSLGATANDVATSANLSSSSWTTAGNNCWCSIKSVDVNGNAGIHENPAWVFNENNSNCASQCSQLCITKFINGANGAFRGALSGIQ